MTTADPDPIASRNAGMPTGDPFRDSVEIPGLERHSVWGYDEAAGSYWVSLWRDDQDPDGPALLRLGAIGDGHRPRPECVLVEIIRHLKCDPLEAARGLGLQTTRTWSRSVEERVGYLSTLVAASDDFTVGRRNAAAWLAGTTAFSPVMGIANPDELVPQAARIHTELLCVSGLTFLQEGDARLHGAEDVLVWALDPGRD